MPLFGPPRTDLFVFTPALLSTVCVLITLRRSRADARTQRVAATLRVLGVLIVRGCTAGIVVSAIRVALG